VKSDRTLPTLQTCLLLPIIVAKIALMMEAASVSETSVNSYHIARGNNPESNHLFYFFGFEVLTGLTLLT
jgi:hypothetical protein